MPDKSLSKRKCVPCESGIAPLTPQRAGELLKQLNPEWMLVDDSRLLARSFRFKDFKQTIEFVNKVASLAEEEGHHPDLSVGYGNLGIELTTHAIDGLSENDFILAAKIDKIGAPGPVA